MSDQPTVENFEQWGRLIKTWATGVDHIRNGNSYPRPTTIEELRAQAANAGAILTMPDTYTDLTLVQGDRQHLVLRLPAKDILEAAEVELGTPGARYLLPSFYSTEAFNDARPDIEDPMRFHDMRIGDYTISNCR